MQFRLRKMAIKSQGCSFIIDDTVTVRLTSALNGNAASAQRTDTVVVAQSAMHRPSRARRTRKRCLLVCLIQAIIDSRVNKLTILISHTELHMPDSCESIRSRARLLHEDRDYGFR